MAATLAFTDHTNIGSHHSSQRAIRNHVMKAKDAGSGRASRKSSQTGDDGKPTLGHGDHSSVYEQANVCPKLLLQVGNELSGLKSPGEMTPQARVFVHDCKSFSVVFYFGITRSCSPPARNKSKS